MGNCLDHLHKNSRKKLSYWFIPTAPWFKVFREGVTVTSKSKMVQKARALFIEQTGNSQDHFRGTLKKYLPEFILEVQREDFTFIFE